MAEYRNYRAKKARSRIDGTMIGLIALILWVAVIGLLVNVVSS